MKGIQGTIDIDRSVATGEALLGALFRLAGALDINLGRTLCGLGENRHLVGENFCESPRHGEFLFGAWNT